MTLTPGSDVPTDETTPPPERRLLRFTAPERWVHHATALLMITCLGTAACLYFPSLSVAVGRRDLIATIHVAAGFLLPAPFLVGWLSRAFRDDVRRLNRFLPQDWDWLRRRDRRDTMHGRGVIKVGKFNAGQKLNASFTGGSILVMLVTGIFMLSGSPPIPRFGTDAWRTGATFVHDWLFLAILVVFLGHLYYALSDAGSMKGMLTGRVDASWAARHHLGWLDDLTKRDQV
jgi:formate dehydrogenase subunit gamma